MIYHQCITTDFNDGKKEKKNLVIQRKNKNANVYIFYIIKRRLSFKYNTYSEQKLSQIKKAIDTLKYQKF